MATVILLALGVAISLIILLAVVEVGVGFVRKSKSDKALKKSVKEQRSARPLSEVFKSPDGLINLIRSAVPKDLGLVYETEVKRQPYRDGYDFTIAGDQIGVVITAKDINNKTVSQFFIGELSAQDGAGTEDKLKNRIKETIENDYAEHIKEQTIGQKDIIF